MQLDLFSGSSAQVLWLVLTGLAVAVGLVGILVPVLPGLPLVLVALLVWAVADGHPVAWVAFAVGLLTCVVAWVLMYYLPGRRLQAAGVPTWQLLIAAVVGVIGFFVVPVVGLPLGFVLALYAVEALRLHDARAALRTTWQAVLAYGLSMLIEFVAGMCCALLWGVAALVAML